MKRSRLEVKMARELLAMPECEDANPDNYTDFCTGADGTRKQPYQRGRNLQCSIGYHYECSDPDGRICKCPCHWLPADLVERCAP